MSLQGQGHNDSNADKQNVDKVQNESDNFPKQLEKIVKILEKPYENRYGTENIIINQFIEQNIYLSHIVSQVSRQFMRNLMKNATILKIPPNTILATQGQQIRSVGLILEGKIAVYQNQKEKVQYNFDKQQLWTQLISKSKQKMKALKNKAQHRKNSTFLAPQQFAPFSEQQIPKDWLFSYKLCENQGYGLPDVAMGSCYLQNYITCEESILLFFDQFHLIMCLEQALKNKIKELAHQLKSIKCFSFVQSDKLNAIIHSLVLNKKKKDEYIYKQGQQVKNFYFLSEGEIKVTKETDLFEQNPNQLYLNRRKLVEENVYKFEDKQKMGKQQKKLFQRKVRKSILPYANLKNMYNFQPIKKNIEIGLITPFCIFGEEEYLEGKDRETNMICNSLDCDYYTISIHKLSQILGQKNWPKFKQELSKSLRKKVLYRQSQYASNLQLQNRTNMDYFYLKDGQQKQSPRKMRISKFNNIIQPNKRKEHFSHSARNPESQGLGSSQQLQATLPRYTTFNFNKMVKKKESTNEKTQDQQEVEFSYKDEKQVKIMNISHTWRLVKQKVDSSLRTSHRISPQKHIINLNMPLIEAEYFYHTDREKKRVERQHRKRVLSLGRSYILKNNTTSSMKS